MSSRAPSLPAGWTARGTKEGTVYTPPWSQPRRQKREPPPPKRKGFSARDTLRRAGVTARETARPIGPTWRQFERVGAVPDVGAGPSGVTGLILFAFGTILGLALLDAMLAGRGPAAVSKMLDVAGGGIRRLFDARDPIVGQAAPAPALATAGAGVGGTVSGVGATIQGVAAGTGETPPRRMLAAIARARELGLTVRENPYVGDQVDDVHVRGSYHKQLFPGRYDGRPLGRAIDVSGPQDKLLAFYTWARGLAPAELIGPWGSYFDGRPGGRQPGHDTHVHFAT